METLIRDVEKVVYIGKRISQKLLDIKEDHRNLEIVKLN